jgi:transcription antitermination factor NusG
MINDLICERLSFFELGLFSEKIIFELEKQLSEKKNIKSGSSFFIPISEDKTIQIKFYKEYSEKARQLLADYKNANNEIVKAIFFEEKTSKADGRIEIYINKSKPYYYKDRDSIDIIRNRLPKFIKDILRHELVHAHEQILSSFNKKRKKIDKNASFEDYINSDEEMNANLVELINSTIHHDKVIYYYISVGNPKKAMGLLVHKIKNDYRIVDLTEDNKKWFLKTAWTIVQKYSDELSITTNKLKR